MLKFTFQIRARVYLVIDSTEGSITYANESRIPCSGNVLFFFLSFFKKENLNENANNPLRMFSIPTSEHRQAKVYDKGLALLNY